jgi:hypothetical protein
MCSRAFGHEIYSWLMINVGRLVTVVEDFQQIAHSFIGERREAGVRASLPVVVGAQSPT